MGTYVKTYPYRGPPLYARERYYYRVNGEVYNVTSPYPTEDPTLGRTESVTLGDAQPGWQQKIRRNQNATTYLSGTKYRVESYSCTRTKAEYKNPGTVPTNLLGVYNVYPIFGNYSYPSPTTAGGISLVEARNLAKQRFLRNLMNTQRSIQGGVVLGELRETLRMIKNPARGLRHLVDSWSTAARKLRSSRSRRYRALQRSKQNDAIRRDLADAWLENAFGWQPLINDVDDAARALKKLVNMSAGAVPVGGDAVVQTTGSTSSGNISGDLCTIRRTQRTDTEASVRYFGKTIAQVNNPRLFAQSVLGFQAADFVPTLWELTPWSFLIDYFTNIGDVLEGWSWGRTGLAWCYVTERRKATYHVHYQPGPSSNTRLVMLSNGHFSSSTTLVYRDTYGGTFTPQVKFRIPGVGSMKWINIAGLLAGRRAERLWREPL